MTETMRVYCMNCHELQEYEFDTEWERGNGSVYRIYTCTHCGSPYEFDVQQPDADLHAMLQKEWQEHNDNWTSIGFPYSDYETWLESEVKHWRKCAGAYLRKGVSVYSEQDIIDNLQARVNELEAKNRDLRRKLESEES